MHAYVMNGCLEISECCGPPVDQEINLYMLGSDQRRHARRGQLQWGATRVGGVGVLPQEKWDYNDAIFCNWLWGGGLF